MRAALLSQGSVSSAMTFEAMKQHFDHVDNLNLKHMEIHLGGKEMLVLHEGKEVKSYDCIYAKGSFRYAPLLRALATAFHKKTYMPINPSAFTVGHDKLLTHLVLQHYKLPMPDTYIVSSLEGAKKILENVKFPIIFKFPQGTQGKGVMFADSFASAVSIIDAMEELRKPFLIQEYVDTDDSDIRAFVIGDKVAAAVKRKAVVGERRANIHTGAKGEAIVLDPQTRKVALNVARTIGAEICAVDMLETPKGPEVIEINLSPGLQGITEITKVDIADKIAAYLRKKAETFSETDKSSETSKLFAGMGISDAGKESGTEQQIVTNLDFRSDRILLPKIATTLAKLDEHDEVIVKAKKGKISVEKF